MDLMLNRWLLYQAIACRYRARAAFYQAGGDWGFRDQLQDAMSFPVARRELARAHLLRAAARQFEEGDVQHWWHAPDGKGVRTRISDDLLWLPYAAFHYVQVTGDDGIFDESAPFLTAPPLAPEEIDRYFEPKVSSQSPAHKPGRIRRPRRTPGRGRARARLARPCRGASHGARSAGLGRRLVSPRLFRRRDPARLRVQRRVPHRLDCPILGRDLRGGGTGAWSTGPGCRG
jgi:hypothetical protein